MKKIFILLIVLILGYAGYIWKTRPALITPYSYRILETGPLNIKKLNNNKKAPIIIAGDKQARYFYEHAEQLSEVISEGYDQNVNIALISDDNDGLHRTVAKILKYPFKPEVLILFTGSNAEQEKLFDFQDLNTIQNNIKIYEDSRVQTALEFIPFIGKFFYKPFKVQELHARTKLTTTSLKDEQIMLSSEVYYQFFKYELIQLIEKLQDQGTKVILVTTPLNYEVPPKRSCSISYDSKLRSDLKKIKRNIKAGDYKSVFAELLMLKDLYPVNAEVHYYLGQTYLKIGKLKNAFKSLKLAASLDCSKWRATPVINNIIQRIGNDYETIVFDYDSYLNSFWGKGILFLDEIKPQDIYYEKVIKKMGRAIRSITKGNR